MSDEQKFTCCYRVVGGECGKPATHELRKGKRAWFYCDLHAEWVRQGTYGKIRIEPLKP